jgi:pimeloyl-ACP methyl ester carboxylesterase
MPATPSVTGRARLSGVVLLAVSLMTLSGCARLFPKPQYDQGDPNRLHHIGSDLNGAYDPYSIEQADFKSMDRFQAERGVVPQDDAGNRNLYARYQALLDDIEADMLARARREKGRGGDTLKVLLFFHGGLNHPSYNDERLDRYLAEMECDGFYPLYVSWRSGAFVSFWDRFTSVRNGGIARGPMAPVRGTVYTLSDTLSGLVKFPETGWDVTANSIAAADARQRGMDRDRPDYQDDEALYWPESEPYSFLDQTLYRSGQVLPGVVRLLMTPVVQGLGTPAWSMMLRRTKHLTTMEADVLGYNEDYCGDDCAVEGNGVVAVLARRLDELNRRLPSGMTMEITLVGHSMGAIVANELVSLYPQLPYKTIIHMGAADSSRNWIDKTYPWLKAHADDPDVAFYNLVLHPTSEEREVRGYFLIPNGSLLVWLDDMLTQPDHMLDRRSGRWTNARHLLPFYRDAGNAYLKVFPANDDSVPQNHGDFGKFRYWREDFYWGREG